jgi:Na+/H+ antiporter NhaC
MHALILCALLAAPLQADDAAGTERPSGFAVRFDTEGPLLRELPVGVSITALASDGTTLRAFTGTVEVEGLVSASDGSEVERAGPFVDGVYRFAIEEHPVLAPSGTVRVSLAGEAAAGSATRRTLSRVTTLLPPLAAIVLALLTRQVLLSLFAGVWIGAALLEGDILGAFLRSVDRFVVEALADVGHAHIVIFSLSLAGMVGILHANGGIRGLVVLISRWARGRRSAQVATWLLGCLIFFDDYANSLIVGNTMRSYTDRVRISREKLAFIVDATAAPVATIGVISTWTAYQLGLIDPVLEALATGVREPYLFFLSSIPFSYYSFFMLFLVFLSAVTLRDFGPMRRAEARAHETGAVLREGAQPLVDAGYERAAETNEPPPRWANAVIPIVTLVGTTLGGLWVTGRAALSAEAEPTLHQVIGAADAYRALLWASVVASAAAAGLSLLQGQKVEAVVSSWLDGVRSLVLAVVILLLAWSVSSVCAELRTGDAVASLVPDLVGPQLLPAISFVVAGAVAFATGTSYGTMGILIPILLPLVYRLGSANDVPMESLDALGFATLASVLGGAVFGDHCSPISDTTVLSSMASGADHIDHVRTQLPYAMLVAAVSVPAYLLAGFGVHPALVLVLGVAAVLALFLLLARWSSARAS